MLCLISLNNINCDHMWFIRLEGKSGPNNRWCKRDRLMHCKTLHSPRSQSSNRRHPRRPRSCIVCHHAWPDQLLLCPLRCHRRIPSRSCGWSRSRNLPQALDIMMNNAGIVTHVKPRIIDNDKHDFDRVLSVNVTWSQPEPARLYQHRERAWHQILAERRCTLTHAWSMR